jgi:magnesium-transporting ATPase (P-type)
MLNLCLNHSVLVGSHGYTASSPDELALVNGAKYCGYEFVSRNNSDSTVTISVNGCKQTWQLLQTIDFTSARKRMTSVFRSP